MSLDIQPSGELATECPHTRRLPADHYAFFNAARRLTMNLNAIRDSKFTNQFATITSLKTLLLTQGVRPELKESVM